MLPLRWMARLSIGNPTVDSQHQHLFDLYNRLAEGRPAELDQAAILQELGDYAAEHFRDEEAYMVEIGYPATERDKHRMAHLAFLRQMAELPAQPLFTTLDFIREWLLRHIMTVDHRIVDFLKDGVSDGKKVP